MRARLRTAVAATAMAALVAGCTSGDDPADDPASETATSETGSTETDTTETDTTETDTSVTEDSTDEATGSTAGGEYARILAIEQRHPNGSVLRLTSLEVDDTSITVGVEVVNGSTREFGLANGGAFVVSLTDDVGGVSEFIRPAQNPNLLIQQRGTLTGELVYFGILDPAAEKLSLQTNATRGDAESGRVYDTASEDAGELFPHFSVEIPLDD